MWKVRVAQSDVPDYGYKREDISAFNVASLAEAAEIAALFKKYGVGKIDFSITRNHEEEEA